ncbi:MAG TPA: hypothetical protein VFQ13_17390 [Anaerolineales bacterium]|nr:hypothetical protein [Anaerolineales bacterium]
MKKTTYITIVILTLLMTACGASRSAAPASAPQGGPNAGALPATTQLLIGTLKLEGTAQAVTAEQAAELLPLWQTMQALSDSDTAADQEKEALIAQIQETMTAEQMQAITAMNLTGADMMSIMQERGGMAMDGGQNNSQNENSTRNNGGGFVPGGGGPPGGMMPPDERGGPGGGFNGGGQNMSEDQIATAQAARQANENTILPVLINAVIEYLQEKAGL